MKSPLKILVVEDESLITMAIEMSLRGAGYEVCATSPTGEEAIDICKTCEPDLILMDIRLAGKLDGIEAVHKIHEFMPVPVVFMSGYHDTATLSRIKELKPLGFLAKPVRIQELQPLLTGLLTRTGCIKEGAAAVSPGDSPKRRNAGP